MTRGELFVQLAIHYADDEKFEEVSRSSRLLFVDSLVFSKKLLNEGIFYSTQVHKMMYPESKRAAQKAADELVAAGLWSWDPDRRLYTVVSWLKRNKSRSQIEQARAEAEESALLANHKRWHVKEGKIAIDCKHCRDAPQ